jgi:hypothetical protein
LSALLGGEQAAGSKTAPDWVPPLMVSLASAMRPFGQEIVDRLLTDPQMESVWRILGATHVDAAAIEKLPKNLRLDNWPSLEKLDVPASDAACVAFFAAAAIEFKLANKPAYASNVSALIGTWRFAARQCRIALKNPLFRPQIDGDLERSLAAVERFFEERAAFVESGSSPYLLGRQGNDDITRAIVRGIAKKTWLIFGQFFYGTIATTVNVGLQLKTEIGIESVRKWCDGLK